MTAKIHLVAAGVSTPVGFALSPGQAHDAPAGLRLLERLGEQPGRDLIMDRAYEGGKTRQTAAELGYNPVVPPKRNRRNPWRPDRAKYAKRNEIDRFFHRLKNWRRIATRYDKLDATYTSFINLALIHTALTQNVNTT